MKTLALIGLCLIASQISAQTLYVPSGIGGIGTSTNGNVGIGTSSTPQAKFEVVGFGQYLRNPASTSYTTFRMYNDQNNALRSLEIDYSGSGYTSTLVNNGPTGESGSITTTGAFPLTFGTNNTFRMLLSSTGNFGVGTKFPSGRLHVTGGGSSINAGSGNPASGDFIIESTTGGRNTTSGAEIEFMIPANTDGSNMWGQGRIITVAGNTSTGNATGKMVIGTRRYFNKIGAGIGWYYGDDITIDGAGNVGIGTLIPDYKLSVNGKIKAEEVLVVADVPDYVFKKDYNLLSLNEIEAFIKQYGHLPGVKSESEIVNQGGWQMGEMSSKLLEKVEELTLHLIDLKKENDLLKQRLNQLEAKSN